MNPLTPAASAASQSIAAALQVFPTSWPQTNAMTVFGLLLAFGVLGGMLAARARWLPSITGFMILGLLVGPSGLGILTPQALHDSRVLVDIALGLILFRLGVTLHPAQALRDRKLMLTSLAESLATFGLILGLMLLIGSPPLVAVLAAAIAVSSSPAVLIHVAEELHAEGPTVENAKALVAANNVWSFVLFSLALPVALMGERFDLGSSLLLPGYQMLGAIIVSVVVAGLVTTIARLTRADEEHFRFALVVGAVTLTLGLSQALRVSGLFAGLALGIACRSMQGKTRLTRVEFGGGGDVFFVILFVFAGANLHLKDLWLYGPVALAFVAARTLAKTGTVYGCSVAFGLPHRQALSEGILLIPMAGLAIGLVQTTRDLMPELGGQVATIVLAAVAVFETLGPPLAAFAMRFSGDAAPLDPSQAEPEKGKGKTGPAPDAAQPAQAAAQPAQPEAEPGKSAEGSPNPAATPSS